jgi:hypothetical protein
VPADPDEGLLTDDERQQRILSFEDRYGLASAEIIKRAEAGKLPPDPEYGEWLLLLGRGDLARQKAP